MIKRVALYLKEMFPLIPRLFLGFVLFFEIYLLVVLTNSNRTIEIGFEEIIGSLTIFFFLLILRIADDLKDFEIDLKLFSERPLPSGRVYKKDLVTILIILTALMIFFNFKFMNNRTYFMVMSIYGLLMSFWFFNKIKIQKSLSLALITHNPIQIIINLYIIFFTCIKYGINIVGFNNLLILLTLYFPGLVWEISRKIRAPKEETEYTTYSKLFGYKKIVDVVLLLMFFDLLTTSMLVFKLYPVAIITVIFSYFWLMIKCFQFKKNPDRFKLVSKIELYEYITEGTMVLILFLFILNK